MKIGGLLFLSLAVYGKPFDSVDEEPVCGYDACPPIDHDKINIHVVPHSHDDVGWTSTVDQYYYNEVQFIISSVVSALWENPKRRFIQVETAFFYMWWNLQTDTVKSQVRQLINEGRLEIINGAWSMNDEAAVHYQSTIDQYTLGLRFIEDNLGKCARPRAGWQIDPFGHSREHASLLTQFGMDSVFFARIDFRDKDKRASEKSMDLLWTGSANLGSDTNIFTSVLYHHYSAPPGYCFDISCSDANIVTDKSSPEYNWEMKVYNFSHYVKNLMRYYPTPHVMVPFGEDFKWQAAFNSFINLDRLIDGFKLFNQTIDSKDVNIIYSTPSCYTKAVHDYAKTRNMPLQVKTDDFFPYAESGNSVWAGYFTSRPTSKRLERFANNLLQVTKQLTALQRRPYDVNLPLSRAMGVMQHHDAITGTEKAAVEKDYHRSLVEGMKIAVSEASASLSSILGKQSDLNLSSCLLANVSICTETEKDEFTALIYNPLARKASHYIQIPVTDGTWKVIGPDGKEVESQLTRPVKSFDYIRKATLQNVLENVLIFRAQDLPPLGYGVYTFAKVGSDSTASIEEELQEGEIGFSDRYITFDESTGLLSSITLNGESIDVSQNMFFYNSTASSGAYIFSPTGDALEISESVATTVLTNNGDLVKEVRQVWNDWATQIVRVYKDEDFVEFDWVIGPIDMSNNLGKEVITRYTTELDNNKEFYTDSNGREIIYRKKNYRPTYKYTNHEPEAGNYFPVNTKIFINDKERQFTVLTDRSEGGSSLASGELELMLSRSLTHDDGKGVEECLNETEFNLPLVVRGSHFVTLGKVSDGNDGRTMAAVERDIAQRKLLQPWVFFTSEDIPVREISFLNHELPPNVHLLTLESWDTSKNTMLIRLEHILEKDEDPNLSKEITVDVSDLFKTLTITSMDEYLLAANTPLGESTRLKWSQVADPEDEFSPLSVKNRLSRDITDLEITLAPMQIRTFIATIEPS